jgi:hypothetical protein
MKTYMDAAIEQSKPMFFTSVGIQFVVTEQYPSETREDILKAGEQITPWVPYFEYAQSITVRNPIEAEIIKTLAPSTNPQAFPDACYGFPVVNNYRLVSDGAFVAVPTNLALNRYQDAFDQHYERAKELDRDFYVTALSRDDYSAVDRLLARYNMHAGQYSLGYVHPKEVVASIFAFAGPVITGRYHGKVLAAAAGVSEIVCVDPRYKSRFEPKWKQARTDSKNHIQTIIDTLGRDSDQGALVQ